MAEEEEDIDDNLTMVTRTSMVSSVKAGGITDRMEKLGVDPLLLQHLKHNPEHYGSDQEVLEALRNLVRVCPECQAVNKVYVASIL